MNILMMTNTYKPILGGLEKSVESFTLEFRKLGHRVIIVAPEYEGSLPEADVIRIPAIQKFNGSDFSVQLPIPNVLTNALGDFKPEVIHAHHPFLIGDTALRMASKYNVPLVFTHHTLFEENMHYMPGDEVAMKQFIMELATGYANLADQVIAPSQSVLELIKQRGVESPIAVVPTGIYINQYSRGAGKAFRKKHHIPTNAFVVGYLGRLAPEKNLEFLSQAIATFLNQNQNAYFLVVGGGPSEEKIRQTCAQEAVEDRLRMVGSLQGKAKADAYHAMDVFAFASQSETQGLVLTEAMASKVPILAIDAPGVREVVEDKINGRLLPIQDLESFVSALQWFKRLPPETMSNLKKASFKSAKKFAMDISVKELLSIYTALAIRHGFIRRPSEESSWAKTIRLFQTQGGLFKNFTKATKAMVATVLSHGEKDESI